MIDFNVGDNDEEHLLPRLVIGLAFVHKQYGSVPWKELVQPAAELARFVLIVLLVVYVMEVVVKGF